ncbi:MAG TPA: hypothetical protein VMR20_12195, partial [Verrucomicrobiae bacterium]|nr:hypothetical protein [Verrucomicrobiae bacterium]
MACKLSSPESIAAKHGDLAGRWSNEKAFSLQPATAITGAGPSKRTGVFRPFWSFHFFAWCRKPLTTPSNMP